MKNILVILAALSLTFTGCDSILDRPQLNTPTDETYWKTEMDARLFSNGFYPNYFIGYGAGWSTSYSPLRGYTFSDDLASQGKQSTFENSIPSSRASTSETAVATYLTQYVGPQWNFTWVRKANVFMERLENKMRGNVSEEAYNHWHAVAAFFKCYSYARLVAVFGDVPYFEKDFPNTDKETMFKDRDSRVYVMDKVHDMLKNEVLVNMRTNDGTNVLNRYVAAAFASRWMLFEGTWQKYHGGDQAAATKYLALAKDAAEIVINSGLYAIDTPLRELFGSQDLKGNKEALMYRHFDAAQNVTHCIASYSNGQESQSPAPNLALAKSFICQDGKVYQNSDIVDAKVLSIANLAKTRDPRFEATFIDHVNTNSVTLLYAAKFIDRDALTLENPGANPIYGSNTNTNDAPVIRYAEVLLNWIEAKAELGGVTQDDIDNSINQLRRRPLDATAIAKGLKNTADMKLADITETFDPARDTDVSPLIWEIRRERRMELVYEHCRLHDIKRWKKLDYMDNEKYPDTMLGPWVDMPVEVPSYLDSQYIGDRQVKKEDGTIVTFNGANAAEMVGFYIPTNAQPRDVFTDRSYCSPIGLQDIQLYEDNGGYKLTQTTLW
ncbi:RagB/SusD family nutrient uptake outer membrane protein [Bacteroides timonensis]|uniref:RagB/SusD family nutrient uptake outer membrane protein n=1 Tax=Bacteroides timonensis TaxID=1470345 RepID=UPI0004AE5DE7|nr:RagB/SusD family nutrient uptake outer membrane protein [Bacteroides timonensis]